MKESTSRKRLVSSPFIPVPKRTWLWKEKFRSHCQTPAICNLVLVVFEISPGSSLKALVGDCCVGRKTWELFHVLDLLKSWSDSHRHEKWLAMDSKSLSREVSLHITICIYDLYCASFMPLLVFITEKVKILRSIMFHNIIKSFMRYISRGFCLAFRWWAWALKLLYLEDMMFHWFFTLPEYSVTRTDRLLMLSLSMSLGVIPYFWSSFSLLQKKRMMLIRS